MPLINEKSKRFLKFAVVGGSGSLIDFAAFFVLSFFFKGLVGDQVINLVFPAVAYEMAVINNFLLSYFWVWKDRKGRFWFNFMKYNISTLVAFLIRYAVFQGVIYLATISVRTNYLLYYAVYILAVAVGMVINFLLSEFLVFKKK